MPAPINSSDLQIGPGILYVAPIGTTEPTAVTGSYPSGWTALGSTEGGPEFDYEITTADIEVAESLDPIQIRTTKRKGTLKFDLAEVSAFHVQLGLNGGASIPSVVGGVASPAIPAIGQEVRVMLAWDADDATERWIYRRCIQAGSLAFKRAKAPAKTLVTCSFQLEQANPIPGDGLPFFKPMFAASRVN